MENLEFEFDGKKVALPLNFKELSALGWDFDLAKYGKAQDMKVKGRTKFFSTLEIEKKGVVKGAFNLQVGLINYSDAEKPVKKLMFGL